MSTDRVAGQIIPDCIDDLIGEEERPRWEILFDQGEVVFEPEVKSVKTRNFIFHLEISAKWNEWLSPTGYLSLGASVLIFPSCGGPAIGAISVNSDPVQATPDSVYQAAVDLWPSVRVRLQLMIDAIKELENV